VHVLERQLPSCDADHGACEKHLLSTATRIMDTYLVPCHPRGRLYDPRLGRSYMCPVRDRVKGTGFSRKGELRQPHCVGFYAESWFVGDSAELYRVARNYLAICTLSNGPVLCLSWYIEAKMFYEGFGDME
jgi:hypothetical protein